MAVPLPRTALPAATGQRPPRHSPPGRRSGRYSCFFFHTSLESMRASCMVNLFHEEHLSDFDHVELQLLLHVFMHLFLVSQVLFFITAWLLQNSINGVRVPVSKLREKLPFTFCDSLSFTAFSTRA